MEELTHGVEKKSEFYTKGRVLQGHSTPPARKYFASSTRVSKKGGNTEPPMLVRREMEQSRRESKNMVVERSCDPEKP